MRKIILALAIIASAATLTGCGVAKVAGYCVTHPANCN